jgi:predicted permease
MVDVLTGELRHGARSLAKAPTFTVVAVLTLALGIGANTAIFSLLDATLLEPLPYPGADRLVLVWGRFTGIGLPSNRNWVSAPEFRDIERGNRSFSAVAAIDTDSYNVTVGNSPIRVQGAAVSPAFFDVLGVGPSLGRRFAGDEAQPGRDRVVLLSYKLWQRAFGGDPTFEYPAGVELWKPLAFTADDLSPNSRGSHGLVAIARVKPTLSLDQARADMQALTESIVAANPQYHYREVNYAVLLTTLLEDTVGDVRSALYLLMGAVGLVLLIACANVANLQFVRASARARELAVRAALGAGRGRIVRQLLVESGLLAIVGGAVGLVAAVWMMRVLVPMAASSLPQGIAVTLDSSVLAFTALASLATVVVFGVAPAVQAAGVNLGDALKASARTTAASPASRRIRRTLVAGEIALSIVLLAGAGLLGRSLLRLLDVDPGFRPEGVLTLRVALPQEKYEQPDQVRAFYRELLDRLRRIPGVTSAGAVWALPLSGSGGSGTTTIDTTAVPPDKATPETDWRPVLPGFFETMGVRLVSGRFFTDADDEHGTPVVIVDETLARTFWPNRDAIGKRLKIGGLQSASPWRTVVGVVGHVRYRSLEAQSRPEIYWPELQTPRWAMSFVVRTSLDVATLKTTVEKQVQALDADQPVYAVRSMRDILADSIARRRLATVLLGVFAAIALLLATVGVYGLTAYGVAERVQELGIRMALGADPGQVVASVVGQSLVLAVVGVAAGLVGAAAFARLASSMLFDTRAADPITFGAVATLLLAAALGASYAPARRAARIDPAVTLRAE